MGTDATRFYTRTDGWCWFFGAIDHCVTDVVGWHVAKKGDRWAALEPIRQGVRAHMDGYAPRIALGLGLRHDWGPQYTAHQFQGELRWHPESRRCRQLLGSEAARPDIDLSELFGAAVSDLIGQPGV